MTKRRRPGKCGHPFLLVRDIDEAGGSYGKAISRWCIGCRDYVSLGPSNDDAPGVAVEIAAADVAAQYALIDHVPGADRFEYCPETKSDTLCELCERHYLTHVISRHEVEYAPHVERGG